MPLSWNEIRHRAIPFGKEWRGETREAAERQSFWNDLRSTRPGMQLGNVSDEFSWLTELTVDTTAGLGQGHTMLGETKRTNSPSPAQRRVQAGALGALAT
jgi:hypothetical protein